MCILKILNSDFFFSMQPPKKLSGFNSSEDAFYECPLTSKNNFVLN